MHVFEFLEGRVGVELGWVGLGSGGVGWVGGVGWCGVGWGGVG